MGTYPRAAPSSSPTLNRSSTSTSTPPPPSLDLEPRPSTSRPPRPPSSPISTTSAYPFAPHKPAPTAFDSRHILRRLNYIERVATHLTNTVKHLHVKEHTIKRLDDAEKDIEEIRAVSEYVDRALARREATQHERDEKQRMLEERVTELEARLNSEKGRGRRSAGRGKREGRRKESKSLSSPSPASSSKPSVASSAPPPVMIFWDSENCNISGQENPGPVIRKLRSMFSPLGPINIFRYYTRTIHAWDNLPTFRARIAANGVEVRDCPSWLGKGTVDHTLLVEMLTAAMDVPAPATFILISGDKDFSYLLNTLKNRGYNLIVVFGGHHFSGVEELRNPSSQVYRWSNIIREIEADQEEPVSIVEGPFSPRDASVHLPRSAASSSPLLPPPPPTPLLELNEAPSPLLPPPPPASTSSSPSSPEWNHRFTPRYRPPIDAPVLEQKMSYLFEHHKTNLLESLYALAISNPEAFALRKGERFYDVQADIMHKKEKEDRIRAAVEGGRRDRKGWEVGEGEGMGSREGLSGAGGLGELVEDLGHAVQETLGGGEAEGGEAEGGIGFGVEALEDRLGAGELEELARVGVERERTLRGRDEEGTENGVEEKEELLEEAMLSWDVLKALEPQPLLPPATARRLKEGKNEEAVRRLEESRRRFSTFSSSSSLDRFDWRRLTTDASVRLLPSTSSSSHPSLVARRSTSRLISSLGLLGRAKFGGR
ncbi:NYN domain-containing protein [Mrakia frigida]|uniref:NYN domain-containing protein n=1 Tax=Mrakia frigida TaxID=29902 RepID=UPI003FCC0727